MFNVCNMMISASRLNDQKGFALTFTWKGGRLTKAYCACLILKLESKELFMCSSNNMDIRIAM